MTSIQEFGGLGNSSPMEVSFSPQEGPRGSHYIATVADKEQDGTTAIELNKQKNKKLKPSGFIMATTSKDSSLAPFPLLLSTFCFVCFKNQSKYFLRTLYL